MRTTLLCTCLLLCAPAMRAQVAPAATLIGAQVSTGNTAAPIASTPGSVWSGWARTAAGSGGASSLVLDHGVDDLEIDLRWQLSTQAWLAGASVSRVEVVYVFTSPLLQVGQLAIDWEPVVTGTGNSVLSVDIYDDGYIDATGPYSTPVVFQTAPLTIRVMAEVNAGAGTVYGPWGSSWSWYGDAAASLQIRYVPNHADALVAATSSCAQGPTLAARPDLFGGVRLDAVVPVGHDLLVYALGFSATNVALPWSNGCHLLVDSVVAPTVLLMGPQADWLRVVVPAAVRPVGFLAQAVSLDADAMALRAGDALRVDVR